LEYLQGVWKGFYYLECLLEVDECIEDAVSELGAAMLLPPPPQEDNGLDRGG
jgi:hypothetical protein